MLLKIYGTPLLIAVANWLPIFILKGGVDLCSFVITSKEQHCSVYLSIGIYAQIFLSVIYGHSGQVS